jgi:hypothetical protein
LLIALWLPWRLIHWTPYQGKLSLEAASFLVRWMVAWLIFVTGLLALSAATGGWLWIKFRAVRPANPIS